jgi:hypothetical protein
VVANARVSVQELGAALRTYFWSVMNVMFVFWIASLISGLLLQGSSQGGLLELLLWLLVIVLCNAAPEVIYIRGAVGGLAILQRSIQFLQENWIEWAIPNALLLLVLYLLQTQASYLTLSFGLVARGLVFGALLHVGMVFRGHLFQVLDGSSHRQRMFRYRSGT